MGLPTHCQIGFMNDLSDSEWVYPYASDMYQFRNYIRGGNKLYAIKMFRELFGVGLKTAKDCVDLIAADTNKTW